jgi:pimeloyl-ACP methyl ester carboxylesterase
MFHEIRAAAGSLGGALRSAASYLATVIAHPYSARRMARRVTLWQQYDLPAAALALDMPALVITGEPHLDRVVPADVTREYLTHCSRAESVVLGRTGHIGLVTRPDAFARLVAPFVARHAGHEGRRRIG